MWVTKIMDSLAVGMKIVYNTCSCLKLTQVIAVVWTNEFPKTYTSFAATFDQSTEAS